MENTLGSNTAYVQKMYSVVMDKNFGLHANRVAKAAQAKSDQNKRAVANMSFARRRMRDGYEYPSFQNYKNGYPGIEDFGGDKQWASKPRVSKVDPKKRNTSKRSAYWFQYERARDRGQEVGPSPWGMDREGEGSDPWAPFMPN